MGRYTRRAFLGRAGRSAAAVAILGAAPGLLAACGSSPSGGGKSLGSASLQLSWIENVEFAGCYVAASKGYYRKEGLQVTLLSGGPNVAQMPVLASGKALVAYADPVTTAAANAQGGDFVQIGALYQKSPYAVMSLPANPIRTPKDMIGKKIGVAAGDLDAWSSFLKLNHVSAQSVTRVPVQFDPTPLVSGEVDGFVSYYQEEPSELAAKGVKTTVMLWDDYGYKIFGQTHVTTQQALGDSTKRKQIVALMKAEVRGWQDQVKDPAGGAKLTIQRSGKSLGLSLQEQTDEAQRALPLIQTSDTKAHGLLWMTDARVQDSIATLAATNVKATRSQFTTQILQEVYHGANHL
ncbi:MAG: ABC transporter substrate-binding protein [Candidatus Dormibacteraceae bacterium]